MLLQQRSVMRGRSVELKQHEYEYNVVIYNATVSLVPRHKL